MTGPEVTAAMKAEDVDAGLVERAAEAACNADATWAHHDATDDHPCSACRRHARHALAAVLPLDRLALLEAMRTEVQGWYRYDTRDIGDAFLADSVVDLIQDRIDTLTATPEEPK